MDRSKFWEQFLKRVIQRTILWNYSKFWSAVSEEKNFKEFLSVHRVQKVPPPTAAMFFDGSKFCAQFLKRVLQGTFLWNYSKFWPSVSEEKIFKEFFQVHIVQKAPPPPQWRPFSYDRSKFREKFLKRVTQGTILWNYFKIGQAVSEEKTFKEFFQVRIVQKASPTMRPFFFFFDRSKFRKQVLKRVTQGTILWNYFKIGRAVSEEKILKEFLKNFHLVAMATRVFDGIKFCEQFFKRTTQGTFLPSLVQIGPAVWEELMFNEIVDDARRTTDTGWT